MIAASFFSLAAVPVALHYLNNDKERFALWLLMSTITGYMTLIDLGMSGSVARLLVDYKDRRDGGEYGSLIKTGCLVLLVQAAIILALGIALAPLLASVLKIKPYLQSEFIRLLGWQSGSMALAFALRIFSHLLNAHQRSDIQNYGQISGLCLNFGLLWLFFRAGHGVFSLAWATLLTNLYGGLVCMVAVWRLKLLPQRGAWGTVSSARFGEMFRYGQAMFLVALGTQLIMASQILIIQRSLGEVAATMWGLGTRMFFLVSQLIWRISSTAGLAFSEMIVRGERQKLQARYREMVIVTASLSGFCAVGFVLCNSIFVMLWTKEEVQWPSGNDLALGVWMVVLAVLHCHNALILLTKEIGFMRYVYFLEGLVFVAMALIVAKHGGLLAVVLSSILCSCLFSGAYGIWRIHHYFQVPLREVGIGWLAPMGRFLAAFCPVALATWYLSLWIELPVLRLASRVLVFATIGTFLLLRLGLPPSFQAELLARAPRIMSPLLGRIFPTQPRAN